MTFNEGDKVRVKRDGAAGTIVYAEDGYYSVELNSGVEMDFEDASLLLTEDEYVAQQAEAGPRQQGGLRPVSAAGVPYVPRRGDRKTAANVLIMIERVYPGIVDAMGVRCDEFDDLVPFDKVKVMSEITGTPMVVFMGAGEMNDIGMMRAVIAKTLMNDIMGGGGLTADILLAHCRKVIVEHDGDAG